MSINEIEKEFMQLVSANLCGIQHSDVKDVQDCVRCRELVEQKTLRNFHMWGDNWSSQNHSWTHPQYDYPWVSTILDTFRDTNMTLQVPPSDVKFEEQIKSLRETGYLVRRDLKNLTTFLVGCGQNPTIDCSGYEAKEPIVGHSHLDCITLSTEWHNNSCIVGPFENGNFPIEFKTIRKVIIEGVCVTFTKAAIDSLLDIMVDGGEIFNDDGYDRTLIAVKEDSQTIMWVDGCYEGTAIQIGQFSY
jgi:hypothetical protein